MVNILVLDILDICGYIITDPEVASAKELGGEYEKVLFCGGNLTKSHRRFYGKSLM